jgi:hypothetical protein
MRATGGCHCGAIRFEVSLPEPLIVLDCNCSICSKKGFLHVIVASADFRLLRGQDAMATYTFGTHTAHHYFCRTCGIPAFYIPRSHPEGVDVNLRALDAMPPHTLRAFDGRNWDDSVDEIR